MIKRLKLLIKTEYALYIILSLLLVIIGFIAFRTNGIIAGGDIWPSYIISDWEVFKESLSLWGTKVTGMGSTQYSSTSLIWSLWSLLWSIFGFSDSTIQFLFMTALLLCQGLGITFFVRTVFPEKKYIAAIVGLGVALSLYNAQTFINPIGAFSIGYFPWFAAVLFRVLEAEEKSLIKGIKISLGGLGLLIVSGTPPMAIFFVICVVSCILIIMIKHKAVKVYLPSLAIALILSVLMHSWWIYSAYITLYGSSDTVQQTYAGPLEWGFVHSNASILNLLTMQGYWSWPRPEYYPWGSVYLSGILKYSLYLPVIFAIIGILLSPYNKRKWIFTGIVLLSLFICKGMHAPFGAINEWLYVNLPFYWLFRDPQVEFSISLYVSLFILAAMGIEQVSLLGQKLIGKYINKQNAKSIYVIRIVFTCILLMNGYAVISGSMFKVDSIEDTKIVTQIPNYWYEAADYINKHSDSSRVLVLPNNNFYQMHYRWGFNGTDEVAQTLIKSPVIRLEPTTEGYLAGSKAYQDRLAGLLEKIKNEPKQSIQNELDNLGVGWIINRKDIVSENSDNQVMDPSYISSYLTKQEGIEKIKDFGQLEIYKLKRPSKLVAAYDGAGYWKEDTQGSRSLDDNNMNIPWLDQEIEGLTSAWGMTITASLKQSGELITPVDGEVMLRPHTVQLEVQPMSGDHLNIKLIGSKLEGGNHEPVVWTSSATITADWTKTAILVLKFNGQLFTIETSKLSLGRVTTLGESVINQWDSQIPIEVYGPGQTPLTTSDWSEVSDCNNYDNRSLSDVGIHSEAIDSEGIQIAANDHSACVNRSVQVTAGSIIFTHFDYRHETGGSPRASLLLQDDVVETNQFIGEQDWRTWDNWISIDQDAELRLFVYSDATSIGKTINEYKDFKVWKAEIIDSTSISTEPIYKQIKKDTFHYQTEKPISSIISGNFSDQVWGTVFNANADPNDKGAPAKLKSSVEDGILSLKADKQGAGMMQQIRDSGGSLLRIHVEAKNIRGKEPPLIRLVDQDANQTIWESKLSADDLEWQTIEENVHLLPEQNNVVIAIYSFASDGNPSEKQYRNLSVERWPYGISDIVWSGSSREPQMINVDESIHSNGAEVQLSPETKLLVYKTSYHKGWSVYANGKKLDWQHVKVNGVLNGWIVTEPVASKVEIRFEPAKLLRYLEIAFFIILVLAIVYIILNKYRMTARLTERMTKAWEK